MIPGKIVDGAKEQDQNLVSESVALSKLRGNLSEAQHSRSMMQLRLQSLTEENKTLRGQSAFDSKQISELTSERIHLATKVKDRDEELKGKARLLEVSANDLDALRSLRCITIHRTSTMRLSH